MFRRMCVVVLACLVFLPAGCGRAKKDVAANLPVVTLHVPDMTDRQGLT